MKVGNNIIKTGMFCLIVVLAAVCGYFVGNHQDINSGEDNKKEAEDKFDRRLAVVNMDEGAMQGEEKIYYASQLLPYSGADYTVTGLQDARNGIEIGLYSAYIVIPADFSRSVNSLNEQPAVSRLEYTIAGDLNTAQKEMTAREIERMAENMSDSLTKVYLSSVMQEFHEVQDAGAVILSNDQKDKELLDAVNAGSLIELDYHRTRNEKCGAQPEFLYLGFRKQCAYCIKQASSCGGLHGIRRYGEDNKISENDSGGDR